MFDNGQNNALGCRRLHFHNPKTRPGPDQWPLPGLVAAREQVEWDDERVGAVAERYMSETDLHDELGLGVRAHGAPPSDG